MVTYYDLIVSFDNKFGIGKDGMIPWKVIPDLQHFRHLTMGSSLIVGTKTAESMGKLKGREIIIVGKDHNTLDEAFDKVGTERVFIAGGKRLYELALCDGIEGRKLRYVYLTHIKGDYNCDVSLSPISLEGLRCVEFRTFTFFTNEPYNMTPENDYLSVLYELLDAPERKTRNSICRSLFMRNLSFDLSKGFPLITTKKVVLRNIFEELMWFIRGQTDVNILKEKGVTIWNGNTSREYLDMIGHTDKKTDDIGPMYGYQWRNFNSSGIDQLKQCMDLIVNDPTSRRIIMTTYNPIQVNEGVLYPCHGIVTQFFVEGDDIVHMSTYQRSSDWFLGVVWNIASYSLLLELICKTLGKKAGKIHLVFGDVHIYEQHEDAAMIQLLRTPHDPPTLHISTKREIEDYTYDDVILEGYKHDSFIKVPMIV